MMFHEQEQLPVMEFYREVIKGNSEENMLDTYYLDEGGELTLYKKTLMKNATKSF